MKTGKIIFGVIIALCIGLYAYAESCSTVGTTQNKYTASGCSYTTQSRTCCSNGSWSDWGADCPPDCNSDETWNSSTKQCCSNNPVTRVVTLSGSTNIAQHNQCMGTAKGSETSYKCATTSSTGCCQVKYSSTYWPTTNIDMFTTSGHGLAVDATRGGTHCQISCVWVPKCRSI